MAKPRRPSDKKAPRNARSRRASILEEDRRQSAHFQVMCRVDYRVGNRTPFAFTRDLSSSGMVLKAGDTGLNQGDRPTFARRRVASAKLTSSTSPRMMCTGARQANWPNTE